jgi:hypothetical protein
MNEDSVVTLPQESQDTLRDYALVNEGDYCVIVQKATKQGGDRVGVEFRILDEGPFAGRRLFQTFILSSPPARRSFEAFLEAVDLRLDAKRKVDVALSVRRVVHVAVKHHERDGKVYANVVRFAKAEG